MIPKPAALLFGSLCAFACAAEAPPVAPPAGAGYVLPDGSVQIVCFDDLLGIIGRLDSIFAQAHPGVKFTARPANNLAALQTLVFDASALAPVGTDALGGAAVAYGAIVRGEAFPIRIAHASLNPAAKLGPLAVIAHPSNPLTHLSVDQVARIFTETTRKSNFTHWGQVGVAGGWADGEIHPCGLPWSEHFPSEDAAFGDLMFMRKLGGGPPVANYDMLPTYAGVVKKVSEDPLALGLTALNRVTPGVKVVGLIANAWASPSFGSAEDIVAGRYAFDRYLYIFVRRVPGQPFDPLVREYLRLVLSPGGQQAIATEPHGYLPLNAVEIGEEQAKLQ
ncbi:MAG: PstS family phosphate ABC transporter substrate-binding protein [Opitutales bacterium]